MSVNLSIDYFECVLKTLWLDDNRKMQGESSLVD